jgi:hypothetical protein
MANPRRTAGSPDRRRSSNETTAKTPTADIRNGRTAAPMSLNRTGPFLVAHQTARGERITSLMA